MKATKILFPILFIGILSLMVASEAELSKIEPVKAEAVEDWWLPPYLRVELTANVSTSSLSTSIANHLTPASLQNDFQAFYVILSAYEQQAEIFPLEVVSITPGVIFNIPVSYYEYSRMDSFIVPVSYPSSSYNSTEDGTMSWEDHDSYTRTETEVLQEEGFVDTGDSLSTRLEKSDDSTILDEPKLEYSAGATPSEKLDWNYFTATSDLNQTVWDWTLDALSITNETSLQWLAANTTEIEQIIPWESEDGFGQDAWGLPSIPNPLKEAKKLASNNIISGIVKTGGTIASTYNRLYPLSPKNIYKTTTNSISSALKVAKKTKKLITSVPGAVASTVGSATGKLIEKGTGLGGLLSNLVKNPLSLLSGFKLPGLLGSLGKFKKYIIIGAIAILLILGLVFLGPPIMGMLGARKAQKTAMQQLPMMPYGGRRYSKKGRKR